MAVVKLKNINYKYPLAEEYALKDISFEFEEGKFYGLIGENGGGKTTLCSLIRGLIPHFYHGELEGTAEVFGTDIREHKAEELAVRIGYVFQNPDEQIFNSTALAEIQYMPKYFKLPEDEIKRRTDRAVELTGIGKYLTMNPLDIPYAIRKFVAIAAIIATEPDYLILDEPTAGQDKRGNETLERIIEELGREGTGVIAISHDMDFVAANFPRIIAMAHKNIIADGTAGEIFWDEETIREAKIRMSQIAKIASELGLSGNILSGSELVRAVE